MKKIVLFLLVAFAAFGRFGGGVGAQPSVSSVSGDIVDENSVVITGSGFGTKAQAGPLISSYDNGVNSFSNMSTGQNPTGKWTSTGGGTNPIPLSDSPPLRGAGHSTSKKVDCLNSYPPYHGLVYYTPPNTSQLYISWWHYRDDTAWHIVDGSGNNNKFFRYYWGTGGPVGSPVLSITDSDNGDGANDGVPDVVGFCATDNCRALSYDPDSWSLDYAGGDVEKFSYWYASVGSRTFMPHLRQWDHHELYLVFSSSGGALDSKVFYWMNGRTVFRASNYSDSDFGETSDGTRVLVFGHVSGAMDPPSHEYLDNIYIDDTPAHVFLSDSPNLTWPDYDSLTPNEIQVASAWSDNSITVTLNQGTFQDGETAYLFVVDTYGNISNAYPVTFGDGGHKADLNDDGVINMPELIAFIGRWKAGDEVIRVEVEEAREIWFSGGVY